MGLTKGMEPNINAWSVYIYDSVSEKYIFDHVEGIGEEDIELDSIEEKPKFVDKETMWEITKSVSRG